MPTPSPLAVALIFVVLGSILGAWIWVLVRLLLGLPVLPPNTPRLVPWGGRSVLAVVVFWIALNLAVPTVYRAMAGPRAVAANVNAPGAARIEFKPAEMMTLSAVQNASTLALIPLLLWATCRARPRDFGLADPAPVTQAARGILAYPLLAPIVFGVMGLSLLVWGRTPHPLEDAIGEDRTPRMAMILVLAGVVLAPMAEELIFRGLLLGWLTRVALAPNGISGASMIEVEPVPVLVEVMPQLLETVEIESPDETAAPLPDETAEQANYDPYTPPRASIAASPSTKAGPVVRPLPLLAGNVVVSLVFATLHGAVWPTPIPIFFLSLGLGFLYQRTGGLLAPIALHMTFNGVSTTLMFLLLGTNPAPNPGKKAVDPVPPPATVEIPPHARNHAIHLLDVIREV